MMNSSEAPAMEVGAPRAKRGTLRFWIVAFLIFTLLGLLSGVQGALYHINNNQPPEWLRVIGYYLVDWYLIAIFSPLIFWMVHRWPVKGLHWLRRLALHVGAAATLVVLSAFLHYPFFTLLLHQPPISVRHILAKSFAWDLFLFGGVSIVAHALQYARSLRERELRASQLEAHLSRARLEVLRSELQPHFLFNTLHAVSTLMHRNVEAADEMLTQLSDLLRLTLDRKSVQEIPLQEEMRLLDRYLGIMRIRFQDRLTVSLDVDPRIADVPVPMFLLQPLVENAIQHGIARRAGAGCIKVRAEADDSVLRIVVSDDGPGLTDASIREGVGLSNTRSRLHYLYGGNAGLTIHNGTAGGLQVSVAIPIRRPETAAEGSAL